MFSFQNCNLAFNPPDMVGYNPSLDFTFNISHEPLIFPARLSKLESVIGAGDSRALESFTKNNLVLGDYNYSNSVIPNYAWGTNEINKWMENLETFCSSSAFLSQFNWNTSSQNLLFEKAYGRSPSAEDISVINTVNNVSVSNTEKTQILCLIVLSSMEFVSK